MGDEGSVKIYPHTGAVVDVTIGAGGMVVGADGSAPPRIKCREYRDIAMVGPNREG